MLYANTYTTHDTSYVSVTLTEDSGSLVIFQLLQRAVPIYLFQKRLRTPRLRGITRNLTLRDYTGISATLYVNRIVVRAVLLPHMYNL